MNDGDREIIDHFIWVREQTMELLRRVPQEFLTRTPDGEDHKLSFLFAHAGCSGSWWMHNVLGAGGPEHHSSPDDRQSLLAEMESWRDRVVSFFEADDGERMGQTFSPTDESGTTREWTGRNRLLYFAGHEVHHHGRIVLALRQCGFTNFPWPGC